MRLRTALKCAVTALASAVFAQQAYASDGTTIATVAGMEANGSQMRIYFTNYPDVCPNGGKSAYLALSDANYSAYVSLLESAMVLKTQVIAYTNFDSGGCHIITLTSGGTPYPP